MLNINITFWCYHGYLFCPRKPLRHCDHKENKQHLSCTGASVTTSWNDQNDSCAQLGILKSWFLTFIKSHTHAWRKIFQTHLKNIRTNPCADCSPQAPLPAKHTGTETHMDNFIRELGVQQQSSVSVCWLIETNTLWVGGFTNNHCNVITTILTEEISDS